jgi:hypothetical protein
VRRRSDDTAFHIFNDKQVIRGKQVWLRFKPETFWLRIVNLNHGGQNAHSALNFGIENGPALALDVNNDRGGAYGRQNALGQKQNDQNSSTN